MNKENRAWQRRVDDLDRSRRKLKEELAETRTVNDVQSSAKLIISKRSCSVTIGKRKRALWVGELYRATLTSGCQPIIAGRPLVLQLSAAIVSITFQLTIVCLPTWTTIHQTSAPGPHSSGSR